MPNLPRIMACLMALILVPGSAVMTAADPEKSPPTVKNAKDGAEMILIPGGRFQMGSTTAEIDAQFRDTGLPEDWKKYTQDEQPQHEKTLSPYYIYKYEVTNEQYQAFVTATGHRTPPHWKGKTFLADRGRHPVVEVSWDDAQAYCQWAGVKLPTESQWEFAARGPMPKDGKPLRAFPWGDKWDRKFANSAGLHADKEIRSAEDWKTWYEGDQKSKYPLTSVVGSYPKSVSPFGIHDLAGNAWEWCEEIQAPYPDQQPDAAPDQKMRSRRGGSWANVAMHLRSADRQPALQDDLNLYTGFRCVKLP